MTDLTPNSAMQARREKVAADIQRVAQGVSTLEEQTAKRMSERVFTNIWLPVFAGEGNPYRVTLQHWVNYAESPFRAVDVVNEQGEVLFRVPSLMKREKVNPISGDRRHSIDHVLRSAEQMANFHPMQGYHYLEAELTKRALIMQVPGIVLKDLETWNAIFQRYGKPPLKAVDEKGQATSDPATPAGDADDFSFDVEL